MVTEVKVQKRVTLNTHLADYMKSDVSFMEGVRLGIDACKAGKVRPWPDIKKELGLS